MSNTGSDYVGPVASKRSCAQAKVAVSFFFLIDQGQLVTLLGRKLRCLPRTRPAVVLCNRTIVSRLSFGNGRILSSTAKASSKHSCRRSSFGLSPQPGVFRFSLLKNRDVGVGVLP